MTTNEKETKTHAIRVSYNPVTGDIALEQTDVDPLLACGMLELAKEMVLQKHRAANAPKLLIPHLKAPEMS